MHDNRSGIGDLLKQSRSINLERESFDSHAAFAWVRAKDYERLAEQTGGFLHVEEQAVFDAYDINKRKLSYLLGRFTAKSALANYFGADLKIADIAIVSGIFGQPVVHYECSQPVGVSITHSVEIACSLAFPETHPMAIDVETVDKDRTKIMQTQILETELDTAVSRCESIDHAATLIWTAKEALSKILRCGMTCPYELLQINDPVLEDGVYVGYFENFAQYKFMSWRRQNNVVTMVLPKRTSLSIHFPYLS